MAATEPPTCMGGYEKLFAESGIATLTPDSTLEEVTKVYDEWAADYDKVPFHHKSLTFNTAMQILPSFTTASESFTGSFA